MRILASVAVLGLLVGTPALGADEWQQQIASGLGNQGTEMPGGVYRVGLPRTDVEVTLDGVVIRTALALGSWLAFRPMRNEVMVMGDLVLTQEEINPVLTRLEQGGVEITALHNHLLRSLPATMYMHVHGPGQRPPPSDRRPQCRQPRPHPPSRSATATRTPSIRRSSARAR